MTILDVNAVCKHFGGVRAVSEVSFRLVAGETLALIGPNGVGKTTTMKSLIGFVRPASGHIDFAAPTAPIGTPTGSPAPGSATCRKNAASSPT